MGFCLHFVLGAMMTRGGSEDDNGEGSSSQSHSKRPIKAPRQIGGGCIMEKGHGLKLEDFEERTLMY